MKKIGSFFEKMQNHLPMETKVRELLPVFLEKKWRIKIPRNSVRIIKKSIIIDAEPPVKQKIKMHQREIIEFLKNQNIFVAKIT